MQIDQIDRRKFTALLCVAAATWSLSATAQQTGRARVVGILAQDLQPGLLETFRDEIRKLGYVEGSNIRIEVRNAAGKREQLPAMADDLLRLKAAVIVAVNTTAAKAAKKATKTVPIVIMRVADPVKSRLVVSLSRPGGNVTGLSFMPDELGAKGIELLQEAFPKISQMGAIYTGSNSGALVVANAVISRGTQLGLQVMPLPVGDPKGYAHVFETAARDRLEALFVMDDGAITKQRQQILELAAKYSLPVVAIYKDFARDGAIIAYGPRLRVVYRRAAHYVDKILKGVPPGDLPVEQPDKFDLFVNLKAAKAPGVTIPQSLLSRANELIE